MRILTLTLSLLFTGSAFAGELFCINGNSTKDTNSCVEFTGDVFKDGSGAITDIINGKEISTKVFSSNYIEGKGRIISIRIESNYVPTYKLEVNSNDRYVLKSLRKTNLGEAGSELLLNFSEYSDGLVPICLLMPKFC